MARKGRSSAILLGALCVTVLAGGVAGFRARIVEEWYFWKLSSGDPAESDRVALKLGAMGSLRAAEPLIEAVKREEQSVVSFFGGAGRFSSHGTIRTMLLPEPHGVELAPKAYALYQLGAGALPPIERTLEVIERTFESTPEPAVTPWLGLVAIRDAIQGKYPRVDLKAGADRISETPPASP